MNYKRSSGFSLIEAAITVLLLGFIAATMAPTLAILKPVNQRGAEENQRILNTRLAQGYVEFVRQGKTLASQAGISFANPVLTYNPGVAGQVNYAVVNPDDTDSSWQQLSSTMQAQGVAAPQIRSDGSAAENMRVSQVIALTQAVPLFGNSGPTVMLSYNYGVIYNTLCPRLDTTCNPGTTVPSSSALLTASNYNTWLTGGTDFAPVTWSTLIIQREKLEQTAAKFDKLREAFKTYFKTKQSAVSDGATGTTANYYPNSQVTTENTSAIGGATAAERQYCWDGWYNLSNGSSSNPAVGNGILNKIGLSPEEFGVTSWGGNVEYCRDYDPTGSKGRGIAPIWGALRVLKAVSTGTASVSNTPNTSTLPATADGANALLAF